MVQKAIINFNKLSDPDLYAKSRHIYNGLLNNPLFPTPIPTLEELQAAQESFLVNLEKAANGDKQFIIVKNQIRKTLTDLLRRLGMYVDVVANGNTATIVDAGFDISKIPTPVGPLPKPTDFKALPQANGIIKLSVKAVRNATSYIYEYTQGPVTDASVWTQIVSSKCNILIQGLQPASSYSFRVLPVGRNPVRVPSDIISAIAF